ncbi:MAG TPA: winged helix-turn-helix domain-containing protein [Terriglobales bacterium]|nr:winged helix-turn-helix domain-containing protein [Terriglobales bacterium]
MSKQIRFGVYTVDVRAGEISKYGTRIRVQDRPFQILLILLSHIGEVVTREELREQLWPDGTFVDFDRGISSAVNKLRSALGDTAVNPKFIETVGRRGYRFIYPAMEVEPGGVANSPVVEPLPRATPASSRTWWVLAVLAAVLVGAIVSSLFLVFRQRPAAQVRSIAILPLKNLSNSADEEFFSEGLTDELITKLASLPGLRVISWDSVKQYKATQKSLPEIAKELQVNGLVQGSVLRVGNRVRITVQLVDPSSNRYLWARSYEREERDIIDLQNDVTREIAENIQLSLNAGDRERLQNARTIDPEAHDDYLKGLSYWNKRTEPDLQTASKFFELAIKRDSGYAQAYAGLADCYALLASYSIHPPHENIAKARAAALRALQLDDRVAEAHTSLALIYENYDWNWTEAEREYRRAIELDPNYATAHHWYGEFLAYIGRFGESEREYASARRLDPFSLIIQADYAVSLLYARRYQESLAAFKAVQAVDPNFPRAHMIENVYAQMGRFDEAIADASADVQEDRLWQEGRFAMYAAGTGQLPQARRQLNQLEATYRGKRLNPGPLIASLIALGEDEKAIVWLERARDDHYTIITWLKVDPTFDPLRQNSRFQALLESVGLAE